MPYVLEINIYQGPYHKPKYKVVRSKIIFKTKTEAEKEVVDTTRFHGSTKVVRVGSNFDPIRWNKEWMKKHWGK